MSVEAPVKPQRQLAERERVELVLRQMDQLPTLPAVAARLLAVTSDDDSSADDVVKIIESDPSLTAAVLRLVRRADLGVPTQAITVSRAVVLLGFTVVRNLVLSIQIFEALNEPDDDEKRTGYRRAIWTHSLAVACAAEMLAERMKDRALMGQGFVCGLLHDIGKIALDACLPKSYSRIMDRVERERACINDVERQVLGLDHTTAGKHLAQRWGLPSPVIETIWLHHQSAGSLPSSVEHPRLVQLVQLADSLIRTHGIGFSGSPIVYDVDEATAALSLDSATATEVMACLPERMAPFVEILNLAGADGAVCSWQTLARANRQLGQINTKLREELGSLEARSACLTGLDRFIKRLSDQDRIADVCAAAVEAVQAVTSARAGVAFCGDADGQYLHCAYIEAAGAKPQIATMDSGGEERTWFAVARLGAPLGTSLAPAPAPCEALWERCGLPACDAPLWLLTITSAPGCVCGVVIAAEEAAVRGVQRASGAWEAMAEAIGLALRSAKSRVRSERMTEELLDLNRRLRATQQLLVRARSISMIAEMAAGAAHELNNPLSVISGRAQMLLARLEDDEHRKALQIVVEQTKRAAEIVTDLMSFAKPDAPQPVLQPVQETLEALCQHWRAASHLGPEQIRLSVLDPAVTLFADPEQLSEILTSIVANAVSAAKPETVRLQVNSPSRATDEHARIVIADNGVGMTREVLEHALDPFFSSRPAGRGRGLGLSRAYRLAEINGGKLWLESTPGQGTAVTLELPARPPDEE